MEYDEFYNDGSVVTDWDQLESCMFASKKWVNPSNVNEEKSYEKGDFLRVWCEHNGCWYSAELGLDCCAIYQDYENK